LSKTLVFLEFSSPILTLLLHTPPKQVSTPPKPVSDISMIFWAKKQDQVHLFPFCKCYVWSCYTIILKSVIWRRMKQIPINKRENKKSTLRIMHGSEKRFWSNK